jgi:hypothetical protein
MHRILNSLLFCLPLAAACSSPDPQPGPEVSFGVLQDVLGTEGPGRDLIGTLPANFVVGDAPAADFLLERRAQRAAEADAARLITIIDVSRLTSMDRTSLADRLLEPALEAGGPVLLDAAGSTCNSLRAGRPGIWMIWVGADGRITAHENLVPAK